MSLSFTAKEALRRAITDDKTAKEITSAIDANGSGPAAHVGPLGSTTNLPAAAAVLSTSDTYADAAVRTSINGAVNALRVPAEARLDAIEAKVDAIIAALIGAGMMS